MFSLNHRILALLIVIPLISTLMSCQTPKLAQGDFPPEERITLQSGGPHSSTAETVDVIFTYHYTIGDDQHSGRQMHISGGINDFKIKPDVLALHINFLDAQGFPLTRRLIYVRRHSMGRESYFRQPTTFDTTLPVPDGTNSFAFSSYSRLPRGRR